MTTTVPAATASLTFLLTFAVLPSINAVEVAKTSDRSVSMGVVSAALRGSPVALQRALSAEGLPVGLVIGAEKWETLRREQVPEISAAEPRVSVANVAAVFEASHPGWKVSLDEAGLLVREAGIAPRTEIVRDFQEIDQEIGHVFIAAERMFEPAIPPVTGFIFSMLANSRTADAVRAMENLSSRALVSVAADDVSLEVLLNRIASQVPGTSWVLVRDRDETGEFDTLSVFYPDGTFSDHHWRLRMVARPQN